MRRAVLFGQLAFGFLNALSSGGFSTLGPAHAKSSEIGVHGWALILSSGAAGLVLTSVVFLRVPLRRPLLYGMLGCAVYAGQMIALGTTTELWVLIVAAVSHNRQKRSQPSRIHSGRLVCLMTSAGVISQA